MEHYLGSLLSGLAGQTQFKLLLSKMCSWNWTWCAYRVFWREISRREPTNAFYSIQYKTIWLV